MLPKVCDNWLISPWMPPQMAVEFARKTLFSADRPSFSELETHVRSR